VKFDSELEAALNTLDEVCKESMGQQAIIGKRKEREAEVWERDSHSVDVDDVTMSTPEASVESELASYPRTTDNQSDMGATYDGGSASKERTRYCYCGRPRTERVIWIPTGCAYEVNQLTSLRPSFPRWSIVAIQRVQLWYVSVCCRFDRTLETDVKH
jgi:hypothetical protein